MALGESVWGYTHRHTNTCLTLNDWFYHCSVNRWDGTQLHTHTHTAKGKLQSAQNQHNTPLPQSIICNSTQTHLYDTDSNRLLICWPTHEIISPHLPLFTILASAVVSFPGLEPFLVDRDRVLQQTVQKKTLAYNNMRMIPHRCVPHECKYIAETVKCTSSPVLVCSIIKLQLWWERSTSWSVDKELNYE